MRKGLVCLSLLTLGLSGAALTVAPITPAQAQAQDYPYQGRSLTLNGTVHSVDPDRDRVVFDGDDGNRYTLDTYRAAIALRDTQRTGETGDLVPGMRLHVSGQLLSSNIVEADRVSVLDLSGERPVGDRPTSPVPPLRNGGNRYGYGNHSYNDNGSTINLRGTVESINEDRGSFTVRISQPQVHTRTVFLDDNTDLGDINPDAQARFPINPGDRVTVAGILRRDNTVLATTINSSRYSSDRGNYDRGNDNSPVYNPNSYNSDYGARTLTGKVIQTSNRITSRDLKISLNGREVHVVVPKGTPVRRHGAPISVHEVNKDDRIRVSGAYDGNDFKASRIEVIEESTDF